MCGEGGCAWGRGSCVVKGGMRGIHAPPLRDTAGQCAGGTHSTGMYSCLKNVSALWIFYCSTLYCSFRNKHLVMCQNQVHQLIYRT